MRNVRNSISILGNLGHDPKLISRENSRPMVRFSVATSDDYKDKSTGEYVKRTDWHTVYAFGKLADLLFEKLRKGNKVIIAGKLKYNKYTDSDGVDRTYAYIQAEEFMLLDGSSSRQEPPPPPPPEENKKVTAPKSSENGDDHPDDDLPF